MITRIDHYEIIEEIGEGGMGVVYKARDSKLFSMEVALKTIKDHPDKGTVEQFGKEMRILTTLNHPNIVDILAIGEFEEGTVKKPYLVMKFLQGRSLEKIIKEGEALSIDRKLNIIIQTCRGLHAAHEVGLVHRDIKPSNILVLKNDDFVKIIDFGIARMANVTMASGVIKGTPSYMSPEQILGNEPLPRQADIFSLGVVFYELLTNRTPFNGKTYQELFSTILHKPPVPIKKVNPKINHWISRIVEKALAREYQKRFSTAKEMGDLLERLRMNQTIPHLPDDVVQPQIEKARRAAEENRLDTAESMIKDLQYEIYSEQAQERIEAVNAYVQDRKRKQIIDRLLHDARQEYHSGEFTIAKNKLKQVFELDPENAEGQRLWRDLPGAERPSVSAIETEGIITTFEKETLGNKETAGLSGRWEKLPGEPVPVKSLEEAEIAGGKPVQATIKPIPDEPIKPPRHRGQRWLLLACGLAIVLGLFLYWIFNRNSPGEERTKKELVPAPTGSLQSKTDVLAYWLEYFPPNSTSSVGAKVAEGTPLRSGGQFKLVLQPQMDCYAYLFYDDVRPSQGHLKILPTAPGQLPLQKGKAMKIPDGNTTIELDPNPREELITVFLSPERKSWLDEIPPFQPINSQNWEQVMRFRNSLVSYSFEKNRSAQDQSSISIPKKNFDNPICFDIKIIHQ